MLTFCALSQLTLAQTTTCAAGDAESGPCLIQLRRPEGQALARASTSSDGTRDRAASGAMDGAASTKAASPLEVSDSFLLSKDTLDGDIDLVYLYADTSDTEYSASREQECKRYENLHPGICGTGSGWSATVDYGSLRLSLRSVVRYARSFIRKIYIITNGNDISWLRETSERGPVHVINGSALIAEAGGYVPNFNSHAYYLVMHRIPGLSQSFLQADDDFLFWQGAQRSSWFKEEGMIHHLEGPRGKNHDLPVERDLIRALNVNGDLRWGAHTFRPFRTADLEKMWMKFRPQLSETLMHPFRLPEDIDVTSFYPWFSKAQDAETNEIEIERGEVQKVEDCSVGTGEQLDGHLISIALQTPLAPCEDSDPLSSLRDTMFPNPLAWESPLPLESPPS